MRRGSGHIFRTDSPRPFGSRRNPGSLGEGNEVLGIPFRILSLLPGRSLQGRTSGAAVARGAGRARPDKKDGEGQARPQGGPGFGGRQARAQARGAGRENLVTPPLGSCGFRTRLQERENTCPAGREAQGRRGAFRAGRHPLPGTCGQHREAAPGTWDATPPDLSGSRHRSA